MDVKKRKGEFLIKNTYTASDGRELDVRVRAEVFYDENKYSIYPFAAKSFNFIDGRNTANMWRAVAKSIADAVDVAENELNPEVKSIE